MATMKATSCARDEESLEVVWSYNVGIAIKAPAVTYSVGGKQFVAVLAGAKPDSHAIKKKPYLEHFSPSSMMFVFAL